MSTFYEDQEVEVFYARPSYYSKNYTETHYANWRKARIVKLAGAADLPDCGGVNWYEVQFSDSTLAVFDDEHIRPSTRHFGWSTPRYGTKL